MRLTILKLRTIFLFAHPIKSIKKIIQPTLNLSYIDKSIFFKYVKEIKTIVEAGAADGVDTMEFVSIFPNATIFAIEPVSDQFNFLKEKFKCKENIRLHNLALDSKSGIAEIFIGSNSGYLQGHGSSSLMKPTQHKDLFPEIRFEFTEKVQTQTFEEFCSSNGISAVDLLWLDLQGKEFEVILASEKFIRTKVNLIHTELSRIQLYEDMKIEREFNRYMKSLGFSSVIDAVGAVSGNRLYINKSMVSR
jgi:FkbM family methyltransferase